jgi:hypothetical protein
MGIKCFPFRTLHQARHLVRRSAKREGGSAFDDGGSPTKIFEDTILYLLKAQGCLSTRDMHPQIQALHPDLCDDAVDRIIDGQHFGKRWKHMVRTAQSHLKGRDLVEIADNKWRLKPHE